MKIKKGILTSFSITILISIGGYAYLALAHGQPHSEQDIKLFGMAYQKAVDQGYKLFHDPKLGTTGQSCDMCHPDGANTHPETYPKYQTQIKKVITLGEMINWCIINPLKGEALPLDSEKMIALEAYMTNQRKDVPLAPGKH